MPLYKPGKECTINFLYYGASLHLDPPSLRSGLCSHGLGKGLWVREGLSRKGARNEKALQALCFS